MADYRPLGIPGLDGVLASRAQQQADQQNELRGLLGILSIQNQMAQQQRLQQMAPLEMALKKAQIEALPTEAKLKQAQLEEAQRKSQQIDIQNTGLSGLYGLLGGNPAMYGGSVNAVAPPNTQPTGIPGFGGPDYDKATPQERAAMEAVYRSSPKAVDSATSPGAMTVGVPNPGAMQAYALMADRTGGLLKNLGLGAPTGNQYGSATPGSVIYDRRTGQPMGSPVPNAPKSEPLVIIQTPNGPRYATRSEAAGQTAPVPGAAANERAAAKEAEKKAQATRGFEAANALIDDIIVNVTKNPGAVGTTGFVNRIIEGVTEQVPGMEGTYGTSATNVATKLNLLQSTIYRDLVGAGQLSVADYKHIGEIIRGKGLLDSPQATKDALEQVRTFLKSKLGVAVPQTPGRPKAEDFFR